MVNILLPLLTFVLIFCFLWGRSDESDPRSSILSAAVFWGVLVAAVTEVLSLFNALTIIYLLFCWGAFTMGTAFLAARHISTVKTQLCSPKSRPPFVEIAIIIPIVVVLLFTGFIALVGWPNQWDTMVYHLSRVDHWVQNRSIGFYPTHIVRQLFNPPWAEYAILHLTQLGGDERFANLIQWFSMVGSLIGVSLIAKHLGASRQGQIFSALVCVLIPMGILQAPSTQNDYITAFWLVCLAEAVLAPPREKLSTVRSLKSVPALVWPS